MIVSRRLRSLATRRSVALARALVLLTVIVAVAAGVLRTTPELADAHLHLDLVIWIAVGIFTLEYGARLGLASRADPYAMQHPWRARRDYALSFLGLMDLLTVLPSWLSIVVPLPLHWIAIAPLIALLKVARYAPAMPLVVAVFRNEARPLVGALLVTCVLLLFASAIMFELEHDAQPAAFSSIPKTLWWGIVTVASVGYGDMVPVTPAGRGFAGIVMLLGLALFAAPIGIVATGFAQEIRRRDFVVNWHLVAKVPLFSDLDATAIAGITRLLRPQQLPAHHVIVHRGDTADAMYFIVSGEVEVDVLPHPIRLRTGQFFGEIALLRDTQRTATVTAVSECQLLALEVADFRRLMADHPQLKEKITRIVESRSKPPGA